MDRFSFGNFRGQITQTPHGPEVVLFNGNTEIARLTVAEFEQLVAEQKRVAATARIALTKTHRNSMARK